MNKAELIMTIAEATGIPRKDAEITLNATLTAITEALAQGEKIQIVGFGSFEIKRRAERMGRNPRTKEEVLIPAAQVPVFRPGKALKDAVAK